MMRYIVLVLLPQDLNQKINQIRDHLTPGVSLIVPAHISLSYPFWLGGLTEQEVYEKVKTVTKEVTSFKAKIGEVSFFGKENSRKVIYGKVEPLEKFQDIHHRLDNELVSVKTDTGIFPDSIAPNYLPHLTLSLSGTNEDLDFAKKELEKITEREFLVDKIFVLSNADPKQIWRIERMYSLQV